MKRIKFMFQSSWSSSRSLPDEIILEILNKVNDFKTICFCKLVSKRFHNIVRRVDTISYSSRPLARNNSNSGFLKNLLCSLVNGVVLKPIRLMRHMVFASNDILNPATVMSECDPFWAAMVSLKEFTKVKSLRLQLPDVVDERCLFKWKVKFGKENEVDSFLFLSPNSVCDIGQGYHRMILRRSVAQGEKDVVKKLDVAVECLNDARKRHGMMLRHVIRFPLLEDVCITDSGERGSAVSIGADKMVEMRKWLSSRAGEKLEGAEFPCNVTRFYAPILELRDSGCVMKEVTLILMERNYYDGVMESEYEDEFEGVEDDLYNEALKEMLKDNEWGPCTLINNILGCQF